jgi:hypothetical protein
MAVAFRGPPCRQRIRGGTRQLSPLDIMKKLLMVLVAVGAGFAAAGVIVSHHLTARHAAQLAEQQAAWQAEKAELEGALRNAKARTRTIVAPAAPAPVAAPAGPAKLSPAEFIAKLRGLKPAAGARHSRNMRQAISWFEELITAGPAALPAIREFLAANEELEFDSAGQNQGKGSRGGSVPNEFIVPPSLRFGLFDVVKQIGGADGEKLLADVLGATGRGVELAWLARALQEMAPNKYREAALAAARELLMRPLAANSPGLDRNDRDNLFSVLNLYGDTTYASAAQAQLLRADGQVDRSTLNYLQQTLGLQAVAIAAQMYDDPRLADPAKKEPLARVALAYVGVDAQANDLYQKAINDLALPKDHRRNLIEDLNQDGFADRKNLTPRDLQLIQNRIALIEQLAPRTTDPVNAAAFKEAYKDLVNMRERVNRPPPPAP